MADGTGIEWADATWNPVLGCDRVSSGCDFCYAIGTANIRKGNPNEAVADAYAGLVQLTHRGLDWTGRINQIEPRLAIPLKWRKPRKIFVNSQSDLFHKGVTDEFIAQIFAVMAATPRHTYQILTKRHGRMRSLLNSVGFRDLVARAVMDMPALRTHAMQWPLPNVWLGVSVEDQGTADLRIPALLGTNAAVRWLSMEPLLGPVDLARSLSRFWPDDNLPAWKDGLLPVREMLHWVVVGGETGRGRIRPMHPDWARGLRDQCEKAGVPFFFKQWGDYAPATVVDKPGMYGGRAIQHPGGGGWSAVYISEPGPSGTMRNSTSRAMVPGDRTRSAVMLDLDTVAVRVGKKRAGRELDGRTWDEFPEVAHAGA